MQCERRQLNRFALGRILIVIQRHAVKSVDSLIDILQLRREFIKIDMHDTYQ